MSIVASVAALAGSYLLGSVSFAVVVSRLFGLADPRSYGSGNPGATNVLRSGSKTAAALTLLGDAVKGALAVWLVRAFGPPFGIGELSVALAALAAFTGHLYPVFFGFKGGKGVATTFGVLLALHPWLTLTCAGIFLIVLLLSGYVSLASMTAGIMFPIMLLTVFSTPSLLFKIFSVVIAVALVLTHKKNIGRLIRGEEKKFIRRKKT